MLLRRAGGGAGAAAGACLAGASLLLAVARIVCWEALVAFGGVGPLPAEALARGRAGRLLSGVVAGRGTRRLLVRPGPRLVGEAGAGRWRRVLWGRRGLVAVARLLVGGRRTRRGRGGLALAETVRGWRWRAAYGAARMSPTPAVRATPLQAVVPHPPTRPRHEAGRPHCGPPRGHPPKATLPPVSSRAAPLPRAARPPPRSGAAAPPPAAAPPAPPMRPRRPPRSGRRPLARLAARPPRAGAPKQSGGRSG